MAFNQPPSLPLLKAGVLLAHLQDGKFLTPVQACNTDLLQKMDQLYHVCALHTSANNGIQHKMTEVQNQYSDKQCTKAELLSRMLTAVDPELRTISARLQASVTATMPDVSKLREESQENIKRAWWSGVANLWGGTLIGGSGVAVAVSSSSAAAAATAATTAATTVASVLPALAGAVAGTIAALPFVLGGGAVVGGGWLTIMGVRYMSGDLNKADYMQLKLPEQFPDPCILSWGMDPVLRKHLDNEQLQQNMSEDTLEFLKILRTKKPSYTTICGEQNAGKSTLVTYLTGETVQEVGTVQHTEDMQVYEVKADRCVPGHLGYFILDTPGLDSWDKAVRKVAVDMMHPVVCGKAVFVINFNDVSHHTTSAVIEALKGSTKLLLCINKTLLHLLGAMAQGEENEVNRTITGLVESWRSRIKEKLTEAGLPAPSRDQLTIWCTDFKPDLCEVLHLQGKAHVDAMKKVVKGPDDVREWIMSESDKDIKMNDNTFQQTISSSA